AIRLVARPGYRAVRLPYVIGAIGMIVVLPDAVDGVAAVGARLDAAGLSTLTYGVRAGDSKSLSLALPRFKMSYKADLVSPFQTAGMTFPFDLARADFSGMTGGPARLAIHQIVHRAAIEVPQARTQP